MEFTEEEGYFLILAETSNIETELFTWQWQYSVDGNEPWYDIEGATEMFCRMEDTEENYTQFYRLQGQRIPVQTRAVTFAINRGSSEVSEDDGTITSGAISPFSIGQGGSGSNTRSPLIFTLSRWILTETASTSLK